MLRLVPLSISLVLLAGACAPRGDACPAPSGIAVRAPAASVDVELLGVASRAVEDFVAWTDRDALCLREVRFAADVAADGDEGGAFRPGSQVLLLDADLPDRASVRAATLHQLCHVLDHTEGITDDDDHPWADDRVGGGVPSSDWPSEAFARDCAEGPVYRLEDHVQEVCLGQPDPRSAFLDDEVFPGAAPLPASDPLPGLDVARERTTLPLDDDEFLVEAHAGLGGLLLWTRTDDGDRLRRVGAAGRTLPTVELPRLTAVWPGPERVLVQTGSVVRTVDRDGEVTTLRRDLDLSPTGTVWNGQAVGWTEDGFCVTDIDSGEAIPGPEVPHDAFIESDEDQVRVWSPSRPSWWTWRLDSGWNEVERPRDSRPLDAGMGIVRTLEVGPPGGETWRAWMVELPDGRLRVESFPCEDRPGVASLGVRVAPGRFVHVDESGTALTLVTRTMTVE